MCREQGACACEPEICNGEVERFRATDVTNVACGACVSGMLVGSRAVYWCGCKSKRNGVELGEERVGKCSWCWREEMVRCEVTKMFHASCALRTVGRWVAGELYMIMVADAKGTM